MILHFFSDDKKLTPPPHGEGYLRIDFDTTVRIPEMIFFLTIFVSIKSRYVSLRQKRPSGKILPELGVRENSIFFQFSENSWDIWPRLSFPLHSFLKFSPAALAQKYIAPMN